MSLDNLENALVRLSNNDLINTLMDARLLKKEWNCIECHQVMVFINCKQYKDLKCFRCPNNMCAKGSPRINIRKCSFFESINLPLLTILKVLIRWSENIP